MRIESIALYRVAMPLVYPFATAYGSDGYKNIQTLFNTAAYSEGVAVAWVADSYATTDTCPPLDNTSTYHVTIRINHTVPVFFPGMQYLPGFADNKIVLSSTAQFRMEPAP